MSNFAWRQSAIRVLSCPKNRKRPVTGPAILSVVPFVAIALIAVTFHEAAHAFAANACGDDTAKSVGRLSLNPIRHVDLIGTILLPVFLYAIHAPFLFGWAKPVPVDWSKLRHWRRDMVLVAAAGPAANFALAGISSGLMLGALQLGWAPVWLTRALVGSTALNLLLAVFNLIPVPPLDGSKVLAGFLPEKWALRMAGLRLRRSALKWHRAPQGEADPPKPTGDPGV